MHVSIRCQPSYASAFCVMSSGEGLYAAPGAMMAMSAGVHTTVGTGGGVVRAALRSAMGGESFLLTRYQARADDAWVALSPPYPGDVEEVTLDGAQRWVIEAGSLLGCADTVHIDVRYAGVRRALLDEGLVMLGLSGVGSALVSSYGGIVPLELDGSEPLVVDTGHLVGYTEGVEVRLATAGGPVAAVASQEGLVGVLHGAGRVLLQTRSEAGVRSWINPAQGERGQR